MPRHVRNFWITTSIDGRVSLLTGGPPIEEGGFTTTITMRNAGEIEKALTIEGYFNPLTRKLVLNAFDAHGNRIHHQTHPR